MSVWHYEEEYLHNEETLLAVFLCLSHASDLRLCSTSLIASGRCPRRRCAPTLMVPVLSLCFGVPAWHVNTSSCLLVDVRCTSWLCLSNRCSRRNSEPSYCWGSACTCLTCTCTWCSSGCWSWRTWPSEATWVTAWQTNTSRWVRHPLPTYIPIYLLIHLSICWYTYLTTDIPLNLLIYLTICWHTSLPTDIPSYLQLCLLIYLSICWYTYLPTYIPIHVSTYYIYLSICQSINLVT